MKPQINEHYNKLISHQNQYAKLHAALIKADDKDGVEFYSQMMAINAMRVENLRVFVSR